MRSAPAQSHGPRYDGEQEFAVVEGEPEPFEIEVRGIPCTIYPGCSTYVIDGRGSPFWSETGYRSIGFGLDADASETFATIERYIDAPTKHGNGCSGKLVRWWPSYVRQWQSDTSWALTYDRAEMWTQWGPEKHAKIWRTMTPAARRRWLAVGRGDRSEQCRPACSSQGQVAAL